MTSVSRRSFESGVDRYILVLCSLVLSACAARPDSTPPVSTEPLYFEPLVAGQYADVEDTVEVVFRDETAWLEFVPRLQLDAAPPPVDFNQMMVALAAVPATSGGYSIEFESAEADTGKVTFSYVVNTPGNDCIATMALTVPFQAIAVRRADGEPIFQRRAEFFSCRTQ